LVYLYMYCLIVCILGVVFGGFLRGECVGGGGGGVEHPPPGTPLTRLERRSEAGSDVF